MAYAKRIAGLLRCAYAGEYESDRAYTGHLYFVPSDTLLYEEAEGLGIHNEEQLLGGIVPAAFIATKAITHSLVEESAYVPSGWSYEFPARVQSLVHHGFSAFSLDDAHRAGISLLKHTGKIRIKPTRARGSAGQHLVSDGTQLRQVIDKLDEADVRAHGVVIEENLSEVTTWSVGQVRIPGHQISYCGRVSHSEQSR